MTAPIAVDQVDRELVTQWLALVLATTGLQVGVNDLPVEHLVPGGEPGTWPFLILDDVDGGADWPGLAPAGSTVGLVYQVRAAGLRADQARLAIGRVQAVVLGRTGDGGWLVDPPAPAGHSIAGREFDGGNPGGGIDAEGVAPNRRWTATTRLRIHVSAARGEV